MNKRENALWREALAIWKRNGGKKPRKGTPARNRFKEIYYELWELGYWLTEKDGQLCTFDLEM